MTDNAQQRAVLRQSKVARKVRARFPENTRVVATSGTSLTGEAERGTLQGTVKRHIPMLNAQGGTIVVAWDNGTVGRHSAGSLAPVEGSEPEVKVRKHERDYADIRTHLRKDHGVQINGTVKLGTFLRHRRLHAKGHMDVEHTHREEREGQ